MVEKQDNISQPKATPKYSSEEEAKASQKLDRKKGRLRFKDEDTIKIKYNF